MSYAVGCYCYGTHIIQVYSPVGETSELVRDVMRRDEEHILRNMLRMDIPGKRKNDGKQDGKTSANETLKVRD